MHLSTSIFCLVLWSFASGVIVLGDQATAHSSIITSVGYLFETFSPYAMIRFFEFSDRTWNISENCLKDVYTYLEGLRRGSTWAVKLFDATSFYSGAAFGSNNVRVHNPNLCRILLQEYNQSKRIPWKVLDFNGSVVPFPVQPVAGHYAIEIFHENDFKIERIQQIVCFPCSCDDADLKQILEVYLFQSNHIVRNNSYLKHRIIHDNYSIFHDFDFYILISVVCTSSLLYATVYIYENYISNFIHAEHFVKNAFSLDTMSEKPNVKQTKAKNNKINNCRGCKRADGARGDEIGPGTNLPKIVSPSKITFSHHEIIDAFSLENNLYSLIQQEVFEVKTAQNFLFLLFAIIFHYFHVATELSFQANNFQTGETGHYSYNLATYIIDVFFFVRLSRHFFGTFPHEKLNVFKQLVYVFKLIIQKMLSLSPSYIFVILLDRLISKYFFYNVVIEIPSDDVNTCRINIWSNILYLDTFYPLANRCIPWTWFISLEVQFFIIACLVLLLAKIRPKYALVIGATLFILSILGASFNETQIRTHRNERRTLFELDVMVFNLISDNICLRIAPYLLGICLGYILHITDSHVTVNMLVTLFGWSVSASMAGFLLFAHELSIFRFNTLHRSILFTLRHTMWTSIIFWITLASATQHGDFLTIFVGTRISNALTKITPTALLIGPLITRSLLFMADVPIYASESLILLVGVGCLLLIYLSALILYILLDGPFANILNVLLKRK